MSEETAGIHLFSNGFEWDHWQGRNCSRCVKHPSCDLYDAIFTDSEMNDIPNGSVTTATAERLGYSDTYAGVLGWPCRERQAEDMPPKPAAHEVSSAGGTMLPGFADVAVRPDEGRKYPT